MGSSTALLSLVLLVLAKVCCARLGKNYEIYPIKQRKLETTIISESELQDFMLTFSFDSPPKQLDRFLIEIKTTDGVLPISSLGIVEVAMNQFVKNILQGQFLQLDEVKTVETTITSQSSLENFDGNTLETAINVTFRNEPSPRKASVDKKLEALMTDENMFGFVDIVRSLATLDQDQELMNVTEAYRRPYPSDGVDGIRNTDNGDEAILAGQMRVVVPAIIATGLLLAGITLLASKMRRKREEPEAVSEIRKVNLLVDDEESDIFSFEAALSPSNSSDALSPDTVESSVEVSENTSNKVVVEIDSEAQSPGGRSLLSFFSGVLGDHKPLNDSERISRSSVPRRSRSRPMTTPSNRLSPLLYAFSDDEEEDLLSSSESGTVTSESMQESPSPSQPYDSITLDELLVEKYSTNSDVDMVSPVHGISSQSRNPSSGQSLKVSTNQDQRTIIAAGASSMVSPKPLYGQSPKKPSPLVSPKPPLYKASPNSKAPAATAAASPQKPAASNYVFEGCPEIWSNVVSPRSPLKPSTSVSDCCGTTGQTPLSNKALSKSSPDKALSKSKSDISAADKTPPRANRSTSSMGSPNRVDSNSAANETPPRMKRSATSISPPNRADCDFTANEMPSKVQKNRTSLSPPATALSPPQRNPAANEMPPSKVQKGRASLSPPATTLSPPTRADSNPAANEMPPSKVLKGRASLSPPATTLSPPKRADSNPAANEMPFKVQNSRTSLSPPATSLSPPTRADSNLAANEMAFEEQKSRTSSSPPQLANGNYPNPAAGHSIALTSIRNARSMSPPKRKPSTFATNRTPPRFLRAVKSMSPPKRNVQKNSPETQSVAIWGKKTLSSPRTARSPDMQDNDPVIWSRSMDGNPSMASKLTIKAGNRPFGEDGTNPIRLSRSRQSDPWTDSSSSFGTDPWNNDSSVDGDPWSVHAVSSNPVGVALRLSKSASPIFARTQSTQPPNEVGEKQDFVRAREYSERSARSESPPKRVKRSGKQPPAEIWNQPLFSQEKFSRDILNDGGEKLKEHGLKSPPRDHSEDSSTPNREKGQIDRAQSERLEHNATVQAESTCALSALDVKILSSPDQSAAKTPSKWSFQSVVNAAAKAASSVRLSFGEPKSDHSPFVDDDSSDDSHDQAVLLRNARRMRAARSEGDTNAYSPEMAYIAASNTLRQTRSSATNPFDKHARSSSPGWLSRARAGLRRSSPRKSTRSPVHDRAIQGEVATKRLRTSLEAAELQQAVNAAPYQGSPTNRRHARFSAVDGSTDYQAMLQHRDPNMSSFDAVSLSDSAESSPTDSGASRSFNVNYFPNSPTSEDDSALDSRDGQKLLMDLVWLEKKIAGQKPATGQQRPSSPFSYDNSSYTTGLSELSHAHRSLSQLDSMSFTSLDGNVESEAESSIDPRQVGNTMSSIVCRDCYAPPGKLRIIIHSTKDGPAVYTVKKGSSLEGHVFPGDLIVSVDDTDTRAFTAEQVMRMMSSRENEERKITVLHFENENNSGVKRQRKA
ncbi:hypothetical protein ACA910_017570 [Epithemia clementina (nom. ined.)]